MNSLMITMKIHLSYQNMRKLEKEKMLIKFYHKNKLMGLMKKNKENRNKKNNENKETANKKKLS